MAVAPHPQTKTKTVRKPRSKTSVKATVTVAAAVAPPSEPKSVRHQTVRLKEKAQVTIPYRIRRQLGLQEGDHFEVTVEDGKIVLEPVAVLDARWRKMLEEALEDERRGDIRSFNSVEEMIEALRHEAGIH